MISLRKQLIFLAILLGGMSAVVNAQEKLSGLHYNPLLRSNAGSSNPQQKSGTTVLALPFFEDFSVNTLTPNASKWQNQDVFVNKDFPFNPTNTGAATFDVLDETGQVYSTASSVPFIADYLTSHRIRLDSLFGTDERELTPADSLYLSFWYQPQGRGDKPETNDSLILQFGYLTGNLVFESMDSIIVPADQYLFDQGIDQINAGDTIFSPEGCEPGLFIISNRIYTWGDDITVPCDSIFVPEMRWQNVWSAAGTSLEEFRQQFGSDFNQVMIPLLNENYFTPGFQFRFFNYGSIATTGLEATGNVDQWNVDFIYLNNNRSLGDTTYNKIGFSGRAPSFLKRYESMPYRQYRSAPTNAIRPEIHVNITYLSDDIKNTRYRYTVEQQNGDQYFEWDGGNCNLNPFSTNGFQTCETGCGAKHSCPPVASLFALDFEQDTASFLIRHYISDSSVANILVDSLVYRQGFYNYFAYDDGTPEAGYSLEPTGAYLAMQFNMATIDTLYSIQIMFNRTTDENVDKYFDLIVWDDNNGIPGNIIYLKIRQKPQYEETRYAFTTYELDEPLIINGNFYVGIMRESGVLSIGFDRVNDAKNYLFYNIDGSWVNSSIDGSLMMRAVTGTAKTIGLPNEMTVANAIRIYPNPAKDQLNFEQATSDFDPSLIQIFDYTGRKIVETAFANRIDISTIQTGLYIVVVQSERNTKQTSKLLITR